MRKLPPLNAVRAFEVAARHVSFTKAAAELSVTHGAVSRQVALLEEWLGVTLFQRLPSQLALTETGRAYQQEVTAALDRLATASMYVKQQAAPLLLRVSAPPTFTMRWLIPRLSMFQRRHPEVEVRLSTSMAPPNFQDKTDDLAIRGQDGPLEHCLSRPFMTELIAPVCHIDLRETLPLDSPADLRAHTLINYATAPYGWDDWLATVGEPDLKPVSTLNFEQMYFALQAASEGLGIAMVPLFLAIDDIVAGRLCVPFGPLGIKRRTYYANSPLAASTSRELIDGFSNWLQSEGDQTEQSIREWAAGLGWSL